MVLVRIDARDTDCHKISFPLVNRIELLVQLRGNDPAKHTKILEYALVGETSAPILRTERPGAGLVPSEVLTES